MTSRFPSSRSVCLIALLACALLCACTSGEDGAGAEPSSTDTSAPGTALQVSFDGGDHQGREEMIRHGERIAQVLACSSCHLEDYRGANFGELIPLIDGLWATNISLTLPEFTDAELERLLREGVHPTREIYLMPSKASQFLSAPDMAALIAFLRTIEPTGDPTPPPPPGFEEAVTARLPDDYWRTEIPGQSRSYHNAAEEAAYFAANAPPDLGSETAKGRLVALTVCTSCHGAALDGVGEPAGDIQGALDYDRDQFERLLRDGTDREGDPIELVWGTNHVPSELSDAEIDAVIAYTHLLARQQGGEPR